MSVSRVLSGAPVGEKIRERVDAAILETGYIPNPAARLLARGEIMRIAVMHGNPSTSFTSEMLVGLIEASSEIDCQLKLERCGEPKIWQAVARQLIRTRVNGVILSTPLCDSPELIALFEAAGIPSLSLGTGRKIGASLAVAIDNRAGASAMTRYLIAMNHRDIAFICGHPDQADSAERREGFLAAMNEAGLSVRDDRIIAGDYSYRSGISAAEALLSGDNRPTAIFASNDEMAAGALAVAHRLGIEVPRQLSVAGFDDTALAKTIWPSLTTVRQPIDEMARQAVAMIVDHIRAQHRGSASGIFSTTAELTIVERESVGLAYA